MKNVLNQTGYTRPHYILVERQKRKKIRKAMFHFYPQSVSEKYGLRMYFSNGRKKSKIEKCDLTNTRKLTKIIKLLFTSN